MNHKKRVFLFFRHFARGKEETIKLFDVERMENLILFVYQDQGGVGSTHPRWGGVGAPR
jgi:hypothetical protein